MTKQKIVKIYETDEMITAFNDFQQPKTAGFSEVLSFTRDGRKNNDIKIKVTYTKN